MTTGRSIVNCTVKNEFNTKTKEIIKEDLS